MHFSLAFTSEFFASKTSYHPVLQYCVKKTQTTAVRLGSLKGLSEPLPLPDFDSLVNPIDHSDLNEKICFTTPLMHPKGVPGVSKNPDDQTEVPSGKLKC